MTGSADDDAIGERVQNLQVLVDARIKEAYDQGYRDGHTAAANESLEVLMNFVQQQADLIVSNSANSPASSQQMHSPRSSSDLPEDLRNLSVESLDLSTRSYSCLRREGINTVGDIVDYENDNRRGLMSIINLGRGTRQEIIDALKTVNVTLR